MNLHAGNRVAQASPYAVVEAKATPSCFDVNSRPTPRRKRLSMTDNSAYLVSGLRTPVGRYGGALSSVRADDLAALAIKAVIADSGIDPGSVDEVILGNANGAGEDNRNVARMAWLLAGFPDTVPGITVNRLCASGMSAISMAAALVESGQADIVVAGGVESMSRAPWVMEQPRQAFSRPGEVRGRNGHTAVIREDAGPRPGTTVEVLGKLRPVVSEGTVVTAGNSSTLNDGSSAIIVCSKRALEKYNLTPRARFVGSAVAGLAPEVMGLGPVSATNSLLKRLGREIDDVDAVELNEAFASQSLACIDQLGLDQEKVNSWGGAIAMGHPLGSSGTRITITLLNRLEQDGGDLGIATMCIG